MTYGCQQYDITRLCRYDSRALDSRCDGCQRTTDKDYLSTMGLWVEGISHNDGLSKKLCTYPDCKCDFSKPKSKFCAAGYRREYEVEEIEITNI